MSAARKAKRVRRPMVAAATVLGTAVRWRLHKGVPGLVGMLAVSIAAGQLAGYLVHHGVGPWAGLLVAGGFTIWAGAELNRGPRPEPGGES